jgi:alcohol dehydrogenase
MNKQKEIFGFESLNKIKDILKKESPKKIFLVTGKDSYISCGAKKILEDILTNYDFIKFSNFKENPHIEDVKKGIEIFQSGKYDIIIAIGGGTVIDMAKLINIFSHQKEDIIKYIKKEKKIKNKGKTLIAIPTTSGTGSEATHFAVIYVGKDKYSVAHNFILPDYSIIDPTLTLNLSKKISASAGMDALSQSIESYWSINSTNESKEYAREAIKIIWDNLEKVVNNPSKKSRLAMSKAANLSGKAINITKTTAPHAISYPFTSYFGISHGHATGLTLGKILIYNSKVSEKDCNDIRGINYVKNTINELVDLIGAKDVYEASEKIYSLMNSIGLKTKLSELGLEKKSINLILKNINIERVSNNPRLLNKENLNEILINIY